MAQQLRCIDIRAACCQRPWCNAVTVVRRSLQAAFHVALAAAVACGDGLYKDERLASSNIAMGTNLQSHRSDSTGIRGIRGRSDAREDRGARESRCPSEERRIQDAALADVLVVVPKQRAFGAYGGLEELLREQGFVPDVRSVDDVREEDADTKSLVLIAEGAGPAGAVFRSVPVPVVALTSAAFAGLGMVESGQGVNSGAAPAQKALVIREPANLLAAGLTGIVEVARHRMTFDWGRPTLSAQIVASTLGDSSKAAIFAYERGAMLVDSRSPARRVGFFSGVAGRGGVLNEHGREFLAAAIRWAATPRALLVVGALPMPDGDIAIAHRLAFLDLHVVTILDHHLPSFTPRATDIVVVSSSASREKVGRHLRGLRVPVLVSQPGLYDEMKMTPPGWGSSQGVVDGVTTVNVLASDHPATAGLVGDLRAATVELQYGWGLPADGATVIATVGDLPAIFTYDEGAMMVDGFEAPARRVGWFATTEAALSLTQAGLALFDAAVLWAAGAPFDSYLKCVAGAAAPASPAPPGAADEVFIPVLSGTVLVMGQPGGERIQFDQPRPLEIPYALRVTSGLSVERIEITFEKSRCTRPAGRYADSWIGLGGQDTVCSYSGAGSDAMGDSFRLQACTGSVGAFDSIVTAAVHVAVSPELESGKLAYVSVPAPGGGQLEEPFSAALTAHLRDTFSWANTQAVSEVDALGRPTIWYAIVYIQTSADRRALDEFEVLYKDLPLFASELGRWRGLRGFFLHDGDGRGSFVFALLPGAVYNALREDGLAGQGLFKAVYLRDAPAAARAGDGSVSYEAFGPPPAPAAAASVDPELSERGRRGPHGRGRVPENLERIARLAAGRVAASAGGEASRLAGCKAKGVGDPLLTLVTDIRNTDPLFGGDVPASPWIPDPSLPMVRPWGAQAGDQVVLDDLEIQVVETVGEFLLVDTAITSNSGVFTYNLGTNVPYHLQVRMATRGAELEGLEWFDASGVFGIGRETVYHLVLQHGYFNMLAQANEANAFASTILGLGMPPARVNVGWLAQKMGEYQPWPAMFTPCFGLEPANIPVAIDALKAHQWWITDSWFSALLTAGADIAGGFTDAVESDVFVPTGPDDPLAKSRGYPSHEFGHYIFCNILGNAALLDRSYIYMVSQYAGSEGDTRPDRDQAAWINEGLADFVAAQIAGGTNQGSPGIHDDDRGNMSFCDTAQFIVGSSPLRPCMETNFDSRTDFGSAASRLSVLIHDVFDPAPPLTFHTGAVWKKNQAFLVYDPMAYGISGRGDEVVQLDPIELPAFLTQAATPRPVNSEHFYSPITEQSFMIGVDESLAGTYSWCQRCRLYAIHEDAAWEQNKSLRDVVEFCTADLRIRSWMPPPPDANDPASCNNVLRCTDAAEHVVCDSPCPVSHYCDVATGTIQPCIDGEAPYRDACVDADFDGYYNVAECMSYCAGRDPLPSGMLDAANGPGEPPSCDNDAGRHPQAAPVCGSDADCDGTYDVVPGSACSAPSNFIIDQPSNDVPTACGPQAGVVSCNFDSPVKTPPAPASKRSIAAKLVYGVHVPTHLSPASPVRC